MCGIFALLSRNYASKYNGHQLMKQFNAIQSRGPDKSCTLPINSNVFFGFHRLSINDLSELGDQPFSFESDGLHLICNGEIYNYKELTNMYGFSTKSNSDCEIILHMYKHFGIEKTITSLDGVFAFIIYDESKDVVFAGRDPIGVRPLFIGYDTDNSGILFGSEAKSLINYTKNIKQFEPGCYWSSDSPNEFIKWWDLNNDNIGIYTERDALSMIRNDLTNATRKRLMSERPIGTFLSGGLDSSLITALVNQMLKENDYNSVLNTYTIGMEGATDLENANICADHLKTNHHSIIFTPDESIRAIHDVIYALESFDSATIRASVGMYLLSQYIAWNTDNVVLYSGEGSDEVTQGYSYFHNSPTPIDGANDSLRLINQLHYFDVCRVDRTVSNHGLEVRVPFLDKTFVKNYFSISPELRSPLYRKQEKYLIRKAFDNGPLLPQEILWRTKTPFSEGLTSYKDGWLDILDQYIDTLISNKEFHDAQEYYKSIGNIVPNTKQAYYYRKIYDEYFGGVQLIPHYWTPKWPETLTHNSNVENILNQYEPKLEYIQVKQKMFAHQM